MQGPNLHGIMGQQAGKVRPASATHRSVPCTRHRPTVPVAVRSQRGGQKYTKGMKASGITWDNETMFNWLTTPKTFIKGTAPCQGDGRGAGPTLASPSGRLAACPVAAQVRNAHVLSHLHLSGTQVRTWPSSASRSLRTVPT